jgi:hypothetical protein
VLAPADCRLVEIHQLPRRRQALHRTGELGVLGVVDDEQVPVGGQVGQIGEGHRHGGLVDLDQVVGDTLLLVPICLADDRRWQWSAPAGPLPPSWRGAAWAATLTLRLQAGLVYGVAGMSKLLVPQWRDGTAMYAVFHDPGYGLPAELLPRVAPLVDSVVVVSALTWAVPVLEIAIAVAVLGTQRSRGAAVLIGGVLHVGIICALGLFSFGLIMIALLLATWLPISRDSTWSRPATAHSPTTVGSGPL